MDIHQLEVFITSAQYMNFTEAAQHLFMVQSAVSHSVATLEKELGLSLFVRSNNTLSLTPAGKIFLEDAYKITSIAQKTTGKMKAAKAGQMGQLHIGFVFPQIVECFHPNLQNFYRSYPNIDVKYLKYDSITMSRMLEGNELDIAFGRADSFAKPQKVKWKSLYKDDFYVIMSKEHPLADYPSVSPQMLAREKILTMSRETNPGMFDLVNLLFLSNGITPDLDDSCNSHFTTIMKARMGIGVVIIPTMYIKYLSDDMTYCPIEDNNAFHEIGIAWNRTNKNSAQPLFLREFGIDPAAEQRSGLST